MMPTNKNLSVGYYYNAKIASTALGSKGKMVNAFTNFVENFGVGKSNSSHGIKFFTNFLPTIKDTYIDDGTFYSAVNLGTYPNSYLPDSILKCIDVNVTFGDIFKTTRISHIEYTQPINRVSAFNPVGSSGLQFRTNYKRPFDDCKQLSKYFVNAGNYGGTRVPEMHIVPVDPSSIDHYAPEITISGDRPSCEGLYERESSRLVLDPTEVKSIKRSNWTDLAVTSMMLLQTKYLWKERGSIAKSCNNLTTQNLPSQIAVRPTGFISKMCSSICPILFVAWVCYGIRKVEQYYVPADLKILDDMPFDKETRSHEKRRIRQNRE
jgi:hypothetical protein